MKHSKTSSLLALTGIALVPHILLAIYLWQDNRKILSLISAVVPFALGYYALR